MNIKIITSFFIVYIIFVQFTFAQNDKGIGNISSEKKIALVIGNTNYDSSIGRLKNPGNDAKDMGDALQRLGFSLVGNKSHLDVNKRQMLELIREFGRQIKQGGVGFFYFSGHGVQVDKKNYIIPITDTLVYEDEAETEAVEVDTVAKEMEFAGNRLNILVLDACRNNGLRKRTKDTLNGLAEPKRKPRVTLIAFAADDGQTASDNSQGKNGLFTGELLKNLETPNVRLDDIFRITRNEVERISGGAQLPMFYDKTSEAVTLKNSTSNNTGISNSNNGSPTSSNTECTNCITRGPNILTNPSYTHSQSNKQYRFLASMIDCNCESDIQTELDKLKTKEETHSWDDKWYFQVLPKKSDTLILAWRNLTNGELGWVIIQRNATEDWFYKINGGDWQLLKIGKEEYITWTENAVKIYFKAPNVKGDWNKEDIQYKFGYKS